MSKHALGLLLIALAGCKYGALPQLSGHGDASNTGVDGRTDAARDGAKPIDAAIDASFDAAVCPATSACVEAPIAGWNGPAIFYEAASTATPPACSGGYANTALNLHGGLSGGNATCTCSCGAAAGTTCGSATVGGYLDSACTAIRNNEMLAPNACATVAVSSNYYYLDVPNVTGGSCAASLAKNIPPATWSTQFLTCTGTQAFTSTGCAADQVCAPRPSAPFDAQVCIYASGAVTCPSGSSYSNRFVRYASFSDTRDCSTCSCGAPTGSCGGHVDFITSTSQGCNLGPKATITPGQCVALSITTTDLNKYVPAPAPTCAASTGALTGALSPTGATTFCCLTP